MELWILTAMQYADYFNPGGGHTVKQSMAIYREASDIWQELGALGSYQWLLSQ